MNLFHNNNLTVWLTPIGKTLSEVEETTATKKALRDKVKILIKWRTSNIKSYKEYPRQKTTFKSTPNESLDH